MKVVAGLGNPGADYDATRHNVGWWVADRLAHDWDLGTFRREGPALVAEGEILGQPVAVVKPMTFMNRSGSALAPLRERPDFDLSSDLLVVVDDAALDVGQVRLRPKGSAGGHNGLRSVEGALGTREYARLRIGVGRVPPGSDMVEWVLSPMPPEDEAVVLELLPELSEVVARWVDEGIEAAMNLANR